MGAGASVELDQTITKYDAMELAGSRWNKDMEELMIEETSKWGEGGVTLQRLKEVAPHLFRTESDIRKRLSSGDSSQGAFSEVGSPLRKPSLAGSPDGSMAPLNEYQLDDDANPMRFINFNDFKKGSAFPRYPNCSHMMTSIDKIDTCNALIVFVSHQWVQENEDKGERTPDNRSGEAFRLCVQGIEQLLEESSIKITPFSPSMRRGSYQSSDPVAVSVNHHAGPLNCFLWIDYCSLMQLTSIKEPVMHLDTIMSLCDVVFTPLLEKPVSFGRKKSVVYGQKPQDSLEVNNDHGDTLFGEICSHFAWKDPNRGYLSRAWCRLEMFLGAFTPCGIAEESIRDSLSAKQVATWTKKMKSFNPDSAVGKALKRRQRVHVLCCREDKNKAGEVFSPVLEVCDDADISDTEDVVVMTDDNVAKPADVHLLYMPRAKPGHMAYYNPLAGNMSMPADRVVIISLLEKLTDRVGNLVCPVDDAKEPLGHDIDTASTAPNSHDAFDCIENDLLIFPNGDRYVGSTKRGFMHGHNGFYTYANGSTYTGDFANHSRHGLGVLKLVESSDHSEDKEQLLLIGRYEGDFKDDFMWGQGVFNFSDGAEYTGQFFLDKMSGSGVLQMPNGDIYEGSFLDNQKSGFGRYTYANDDVYTGHFYGDVKHGHGIMKFRNGDCYEGGYKDDVRCGEGKYVYANGDVFTGHFESNKRNGFGVYTHARNGEQYSGHWKDSLSSGVGVYKYASGDTFSGKWVAGKRPSTGVYTCANGDVFTGSFEEGKRSGQGDVRYHNGVTYSGGWKCGRYHGEGHLIHPNGYQYIGMFLSGRKHGVGKLTYADGSFYDGEFMGDKRNGFGRYESVSGNYVYEGFWKDDIKDKSGELMKRSTSAASYKGELKMGLKHGQGILRLPNAEMYDGSWNEDKKHGYGSYNYCNGDSYVGDWVNDYRHGNGCQTYANGDVYTGAFFNDVKTGQGKKKFANSGLMFVGDFVHGKPHGKGKMFDTDGEEVYDGDVLQGQETGRCRKVYPTGVYEGEVLNNMRQGEGCFYHVDGSLAYTGQWRDDAKDGEGVYYYQDHSIYTGNFSCNQRQGFGSLTAGDGNVIYAGEWADDRRADSQLVPRLTSMDNINNFYEHDGESAQTALESIPEHY